MQMDMIGYSGAGHVTLVDTKVEAVGMHGLLQSRRCQLGCGEDVSAYLGRELLKVAGVKVRNDHEVPGVVRIEIEHDEAGRSPIYDEICLIFLFPGLGTEDTSRLRFVFGEIRHAPWRPELIHLDPSSLFQVIIRSGFVIIGDSKPREDAISSVTNGRRAPRLSIVIPAHNEVRRLPETLARLHHYLREQPYSWEIIVVSNASTDGTEALVREMAGTIPGLQLLTLTGRGKGLAVRAGAIRSWGEVVFLCDADLSMPPETLAQFLGVIETCDIVVGSREAAGATRYGEPWQRHLMGRVFNHLVQWLAVKGIKDTQCGFKAFRRTAADHLFGQQFVTGWGFDVELLYLAQKYGYRVKEIGIDWYFDADSRVRPGIDTLNMATELLMIRLRDLLRRYQPAPSRATPSVEEHVG